MNTSNGTRPPAVAGRFYSADRDTLQREVDDMIARAGEPGNRAPDAIISPHAGFMFSGDVAAIAWRRFRPAIRRVRRVVILGPSHFVAFRGLAVSGADRFATPLGDVSVDDDGRQALLALPGVAINDHAHEREHAIETQLPFLQRVLGDVAIVPLVVGDADAARVERVISTLAPDEETVVAISSDLSHFLDDATARERDAGTAQRIEALDGDGLSPHDACGFLPIAGLLRHANTRGGTVTTLELRNSADADGPRDSVVGYGAFELRGTGA